MRLRNRMLSTAPNALQYDIGDFLTRVGMTFGIISKLVGGGPLLVLKSQEREHIGWSLIVELPPFPLAEVFCVLPSS